MSNISFKENVERYGFEVKRFIAKTSKACIITFGCQQNEADSEKIRGMVREMGYGYTENPEKAALIILNTCAIRQHAEDKVLSLLGRFKPIKERKSDLIIGVVGCMAAEAHVAKLLKGRFKYVSFTLEPSALERLPELIYDAVKENARNFVFGCNEWKVVEGIPTVRDSDFRAKVSVMYGCNNFCSYCIVPYVRGRERSRNSIEIINECRELIKQGYKEITLLGQNVNSYKSDVDFAELLRRIAEIDGDFVLRFMTSHPKDVSDELIKVMSEHSDKIAPHFHLPLQSGSNSVLKAMNRTYDREKFLNTVGKLRNNIPGIAITSDVIVGFPGETEEDFEATLDVLHEVKFDMVYSFIYSKREGTRAASMDNQVDAETKSERMTKLLKLQCDISKEKNEEYLDRSVRVLVDGKDKSGKEKLYTARTLTNKLVHFVSDADHIGKFINVKIVRAGAFDLFGEEI